MVGANLYVEDKLYKLPEHNCLPQVLSGRVKELKANWRWSPPNKLLEINTDGYEIVYGLSDGVTNVRIKDCGAVLNFESPKQLHIELMQLLEAVILDANSKAWSIIDLVEGGKLEPQ